MRCRWSSETVPTNETVDIRCSGLRARRRESSGSNARWHQLRRERRRLEKLDRRRQLRDHQIVDGPVLAARRLDPDLSDQDGVADLLDAPHQAGIDVKGILIEHEVRLGNPRSGRAESSLPVASSSWTQSDPAGQRPQHRLERRHGALQPAGERAALASVDGHRQFGRHAVLARPCGLKPGIVDVDLGRGVAQARQSSLNRNRRRRTGWHCVPPSALHSERLSSSGWRR